MKKLYMKQKIMTISEKFKITDENGHVKYYVEGSLMKVPKSFKLLNERQKEVGVISKRMVSLFPKFVVKVKGEDKVEIEKQLTLWRAKYKVHGNGIKVVGNLLDMNFKVTKKGQTIGEIKKKWVSIGDSFEIKVMDETYETLLVAMVVAIDYVKDSEKTTGTNETKA